MFATHFGNWDTIQIMSERYSKMKLNISTNFQDSIIKANCQGSQKMNFSPRGSLEFHISGWTLAPENLEDGGGGGGATCPDLR